MKIHNGKWIDEDDQPLSNFNYDNFKKLKETLLVLYGNEITYDRINVMSFLINKKEGASKLINVIDNEEILNKL
jgi:hypothetical protein